MCVFWLGLVFSLSVCKAPSLDVRGREASSKVDLEQLNWVSVWIFPLEELCQRSFLLCVSYRELW